MSFLRPVSSMLPLHRCVHLVSLPHTSPKPLLTEEASLHLHTLLSRTLDMYSYYTGLHLALRNERVLGLRYLTRELGRQHCDEAQALVRLLHTSGRQVWLEQLCHEEQESCYLASMEQELHGSGVLGLLVPRLQEAVEREEALCRLLGGEMPVMVQEKEKEVERFNTRLASLEHGLQHLVEARREGGEVGNADLLISERMLPRPAAETHL